MSTLVEVAYKIRPLIEKAADFLDDRQASLGPELMRQLKFKGGLVEAGTRINWHGQVKRATVDLWDTEQSSPEYAPALWSDIMYRDGERIIPDRITPGLAFARGELGWWKDTLYECLSDHTVWTPEQYPDFWKIAEVQH